MWCPKCKTEYMEGITVCADCKTKLIEKPATADFVNVCEIRDERTADELLEFLQYSKVEGAVKEYKEDSSGFQILVPEKLVKKAEKMVQGYLLGKEEEKREKEDAGEVVEQAEDDDSFVVQEKVETNVSLEEEAEIEKKDTLFSEEVEEDSSELLHTDKKEYVKKTEQYADLKVSGITFIVFGVLGGIYLLLTKLEVIPISYSMFIFCVISVLFAGFVISGFLSFVKAGKIKELIPAEEEKISEIKAWMKENITGEMLEGWKDSSVSPSENDLILIAHMQVVLKKQFPAEDKLFLEMLADEYYDENVLME